MRSSLIRALCAIIMGGLLIEFREQTVTWLTVALGVLFLISGVVSCAAYIVSRRSKDAPEVFDAKGRQISGMKPSFPIVGIGSLILGLILVVIPNTFVAWLMYIFAAILIVGALSQYVSLISASHYSRIGLFFWVLPTVILLVGLVAIIKPSAVAAAPLLVLGLGMIVFGVTETINTIKIYKVRKAWEKAAKEIPSDNIDAEAETVDAAKEE